MLKETEFELALKLAKRVLDRPNFDPDDDLCILARQFKRRVEELATYEGIVGSFETVPVTWLPAMLVTLVEVVTRRRVFKIGMLMDVVSEVYTKECLKLKKQL